VSRVIRQSILVALEVVEPGPVVKQNFGISATSLTTCISTENLCPAGIYWTCNGSSGGEDDVLRPGCRRGMAGVS